MITSSNINFDQVIEGGKLIRNSYYALYYMSKETGKCRLGISIPKSKLQKAHERNRLRRVIRNSVGALKNESIDVVFLLRKNLDQSAKNDAIIVRDLLLKDSNTILLTKKKNGIR